MKIIRFANSKDEYKKLLDFFRIVDRDFYPPLSNRCSLKAYLDSIVSKGVILYFLKNRKIIGLVGYYYFSTTYDSAYIKIIAILKECRGKKFGTALIGKCFLDLKNNNSKKVRIKTWSTNKISIHLYEKFGFKEYDVIKNDRGYGVDTIYFEKDL